MQIDKMVDGELLLSWSLSASENWTTNLTSNYNSTLDGEGGLSPSLGLGDFNWSFIVVLVFVVAGIVGNVLVCLAVWLERPLQNVTNWFLVSLAFADLIVSTIVMPFGATAGFLGYWPLGVTWCNVYVTCDVLACSASILHMCCISLGRYLGIRSPIKARRGGLGGYSLVAGGGSKRLVAVRVVLVWLLALLISSPISALGLIDSKNIMIDDQCVINHRGFAFFGSVAAFILPMLIMVVSYALTVNLLRNKARQHQQQLVNRAPGGGNGSAGRPGTGRPDDAPAELQLVRERGTQTPACVSRERRKLVWKARMSFGISGSVRNDNRRKRNRNNHGIGGEGGSEDDDEEQRRQPVRILRASRSRKISSNSSGGGGSGVVATMTPNISSAASVANEQKASKVLGVVFFTFVLCWAPFFLLNLVMVVFPSSTNKIPDRLVATCLWLGYVSSTINPLIYTVFNRTFKRAFIRLLRCRCNKSPANAGQAAAAAAVAAAVAATVHHQRFNNRSNNALSSARPVGASVYDPLNPQQQPPKQQQQQPCYH